jgi:hypothetical protein
VSDRRLILGDVCDWWTVMQARQMPRARWRKATGTFLSLHLSGDGGGRTEVVLAYHLRPRLVVDGGQEVMLGITGLPCNARIEEATVSYRRWVPMHEIVTFTQEDGFDTVVFDDETSGWDVREFGRIEH